MAPVDSPAVDSAVNATGQMLATLITYAVALTVIVAVGLLCRRERTAWPVLALLSGALTCLLEPLYDHLYGMWFPTQGQWTLFATYGMSLPVWLPPIYLAYYGGGAVLVWRLLSRGANARDVFRLYLGMVALAVLAEEIYINVFGVYNYQDSQPFVVFGYPIFVAFVNSVSPMVAGAVYFRLVPLLRGWSRVALMSVIPVCFAADAFGTGFLYLAVRHSTDDPPMLLMSLLALTCVAGSAGFVWISALLATAERVPASGEPADVAA